MKRLIKGLAAVAVVAMAIDKTWAAPIVDLQLLGNTDNGSTYSSSVNVKAGDTVFYEVVAQLAPVGTTNTQLGTASPITAETAGTDGINSLKINLNAPTGGVTTSISSPGTLDNGWSAGTGSSTGSVTNGNTIVGIRPILSAGVFQGINGQPQVIYSGQFTVSTATDIGSVSLGNFSTPAGTFKINNGANTKFITSTTESNADPYTGFAALTLTPASVPEPGSLALVGLGAIGLLNRRRRA